MSGVPSVIQSVPVLINIDLHIDEFNLCIKNIYDSRIFPVVRSLQLRREKEYRVSILSMVKEFLIPEYTLHSLLPVVFLKNQNKCYPEFATQDTVNSSSPSCPEFATLDR